MRGPYQGTIRSTLDKKLKHGNRTTYAGRLLPYVSDRVDRVGG